MRRKRRYCWNRAAARRRQQRGLCLVLDGSTYGFEDLPIDSACLAKLYQFGCGFLIRDCVLPHCLEQLTCNARDVKPQRACYAASGLFLNQKR